MKIQHISDTHGFHDLLNVHRHADMVIHSGDCSNSNNPLFNEGEVRSFIEWFGGLNVKHKIYVPGNHDISIERGLVTRRDFTEAGINYIENSGTEIEGIKIWGTPCTRIRGNHTAFARKTNKLNFVWENIPDDTDIVISHGAPKGVLDLAYTLDGKLEFCGDQNLMNKIKKIKPQLMLFGHIHNNKDIVNTGTRKLSDLRTIFSNGSVVTDRKFGELTSHGNQFTIKI